MGAVVLHVTPSMSTRQEGAEEARAALSSPLRVIAPGRTQAQWADKNAPLISIIIPVYNEEAVLPELLTRLSRVCAAFPNEIIFINDGSADNSLEVLLQLAQEHPNVKVLELSRNFGHQMAIAAGLDYARGEAVIMMDGDLQHPPELIPELIRMWQDGYDVVYTYRETTEDAGLVKKWTSNFFYTLINRLADVRIPEGAADFRLMDRAAVEAFRTVSERSLFLRGIVSWMGFRQIAVKYHASARFAGKSKYSLMKMLRLAVDGITSFSSVPLYISVAAGALVSLLAFLYAAYALYARLVLNRTLEGWTSVMAAVLFLGGMLLITLGVQGLYVGRIYKEVKARPRYLVRRVYQCGNDGPLAGDATGPQRGAR